MDECSVALNISECDEERRGGVGLEKECATECLWDEEGRAGTEEARGGFSRDRQSWKKPVFAVTKQKCEGLYDDLKMFLIIWIAFVKKKQLF